MRTILTGIVCFLVGAASSPKAANENETLSLLCHRFTESATAWDVAQGVADDELKKMGGVRVGVDRKPIVEAVGLSLSLVRDSVCLRSPAPRRRVPGAIKDDVLSPAF